MSSPLAIAAVTAVLKDLLNDGLIKHDLAANVGSFIVSSLPPDRIETGAQEPNQLNLFLYAVTPNAGWRNAGLPSLDSRGNGRLNTPPLALDLHYLLTAYGREDLNAEILLGYGMYLLHQMPVLARAGIRQALTTPSPVTTVLQPPTASGWTATDLADQIELIKLTPQIMNTEEISKLWSALQARYRPSAAYVASVVLIQETAPMPTAIPVRQPVVTVTPFRRPFIAALEPQVVVAGETLAIKGFNLKGASTKVSFGATAVSVNPASDERIDISPPASLRAGVNTAQVLHEVSLGKAPTPHPGAGFESNVVAFVLAPRITTAAPLTAVRGATLTFDVTPAVASDQRVILLIGDQALPLPARSAAAPPATTLSFPIPAKFTPGSFLMRVQVDGAPSSLDVDTATGSPTINQYIGPQVTIT
jgi:hypothetical protein